jgi:nitroimidazol reductase NimA-like FMN-containing flavoprotein (pyridoxamine 5'-phosphate oxidase superfamily)
MTKYHLNKKENEITNKEELLAIIKRGKYTTLSLCRDNEPYIVTLNYGFDQAKQALYFHTSGKGLKIDFIKQNPNVCGTIIEDKGYKMGKCDHAFRSVVFWGTLYVVEEMEGKKYGMDILLHHLEKEPTKMREKLLVDDAIYERRNLAILRLDIHDITGKTAG